MYVDKHSVLDFFTILRTILVAEKLSKASGINSPILVGG